VLGVLEAVGAGGGSPGATGVEGGGVPGAVGVGVAGGLVPGVTGVTGVTDVEEDGAVVVVVVSLGVLVPVEQLTNAAPTAHTIKTRDQPVYDPNIVRWCRIPALTSNGATK